MGDRKERKKTEAKQMKMRKSRNESKTAGIIMTDA